MKKSIAFLLESLAAVPSLLFHPEKANARKFKESYVNKNDETLVFAESGGFFEVIKLNAKKDIKIVEMDKIKNVKMGGLFLKAITKSSN